ncbi:hypothetical protein GCM10009624_23440 [Gordonia sinesedis]
MELCSGLPAGELHQGRLLDTDAWFLTSTDPDEAARRRRCQLSTLEDRDLLRALAGLPYAEPVAREGLSIAQRRVLDTAPVGVVESIGDSVKRVAQPLLRVHAAVVLHRQWAAGLTKASVFAGVCPRVLLLTGPAAIDAFDLTEAQFYGIGVIDASNPAELEVLVLPDLTPRPFGPVSWRLTEIAAAQFGHLSSL